MGDPDSIPGSERSPAEGNGNPFQYSCLENPRDRGAWQATVYRVAKSQTQLSTYVAQILVPQPEIYSLLWTCTHALSCPTLCNPIDCSLPGSSVPGIFQARILEWVAISFSNACMHAVACQLSTNWPHHI